MDTKRVQDAEVVKSDMDRIVEAVEKLESSGKGLSWTKALVVLGTLLTGTTLLDNWSGKFWGLIDRLRPRKDPF